MSRSARVLAIRYRAGGPQVAILSIGVRNRAAINALEKCGKLTWLDAAARCDPMSEMVTTIEPSTLGLHSVESYEPLIGPERVDRILRKAQNVRDLHVIHVSATFYGGGVTEILQTRSRVGAPTAY
jgi:hypothetical protein